MADRCEHCGTRLDGMMLHSDSCPTMNEEIRDESAALRAEVEELGAEVDGLRAALREALDRIEEWSQFLADHGEIIDCDYGRARSAVLRKEFSL